MKLLKELKTKMKILSGDITTEYKETLEFCYTPAGIYICLHN